MKHSAHETYEPRRKSSVFLCLTAAIVALSIAVWLSGCGNGQGVSSATSQLPASATTVMAGDTSTSLSDIRSVVSSVSTDSSDAQSSALSDTAAARVLKDGSQIAIVAGDIGSESLRDIYLLRAGGVQKLTDSGDNYSPTWSPDGKAVAYVHEGDSGPRLWAAAPGGGLDLTGGTSAAVISSPHWSPNGAAIVFEAYDGGHANLVASKADGTGTSSLLSIIGGEISPTYSPDSSSIAFVSDSKALSLISTDGTNLRRLIENISISDFEWSPDGSKIAYISGDQNTLNVVSADGTPIMVLRTDIRQPMGFSNPHWSPDGFFVLLETPFGDIYVADLHAQVIRCLLDGYLAGDNGSPVWSPDGSKIAFCSVTGGKDTPEKFYHAVYVMNADGSDPEVMCEFESAGAREIAWSSPAAK